MFLTLPSLLVLSFAALSAQAQSTTVCVAGQCLAGNSNISIGSTITTSTGSLFLLPGTYGADSSLPSQLSAALKSTTAKFTSPDGFTPASSNSPPQLPLTIAPIPGIITYTSAPFGGRSTFRALTNTSADLNTTEIPSGSILLAPNTWASVLTSTSSRLVLWDTAPYLSQLPAGTTTSQLTLVDFQSSTCTPSCSSAGRCTAEGKCVCDAGFTGASCESCAPGFFGPNCQPCPAGCTTCDEGIGGTGVCLSSPSASSAPSTCNCENGVCQKGSCTCNPGWTTPTGSANGTACSACAAGFFKTAAGECQLCALGCTSCSDSTGICTQCASGFTPDANDRTKCIATPSVSGAGIVCPDGSFGTANSPSCSACDVLCKTCRGPLSTDCIVCGAGRFNLEGVCVSVDASGVCSGSNRVANNAKASCDSCPSKCTACGIPGFSVASTFDQVKCTKCLPGFVLSDGQCIGKCPAGTFIGSDGMTCTPCDSGCSTCAGSAEFCLTCAGANQLASGGTCVSSCPSNAVASSNGACVPCHPDCATCSGPGFNQCTSCSASRPVPASGRCLPTCSKNEFFDSSSSSCKTCDASCSSCSAAGPNGCLACANPDKQVLRGGTCVSAECGSSSPLVVSNLGVCLSELVAAPDAPKPSFTVTPSPQPTGDTAVVVVARPLEWWQILLIVLGAVSFIILLVICWRRRARRARKKQTEEFKRKVERRGLFRRTFHALFGGRSKKPEPEHDLEREPYTRDDMSLREGTRRPSIDGRSMLSASYGYEQSRPRYRSNSSAASDDTTPTTSTVARIRQLQAQQERERAEYDLSVAVQSQRPSSPSIYSHVTGNTRRVPEPKLPLRDNTTSRFSDTTMASSMYPPAQPSREANRLRREKERERRERREQRQREELERAKSPAPELPVRSQTPVAQLRAPSPPPLLQFSPARFDFAPPQQPIPQPSLSRTSEAEAYKYAAMGAPTGATGTLAHQGQTYWLVPQPTGGSIASSSASSLRSQNSNGDLNPFRTRRL